MKNNSSRNFPFTSLAIVLFTILSGFVVNLLTSDEKVKKWLETHNIETAELIGGTIFIGFVLLLLEYFRGKTPNPSNDDNIEPDIKRLYDSLKERYQKRYESKLDGRFEISLEVSDNFDSPNPRSITEQFSKNATQGIAIEVIRKVFDKKGRLLIVGNPGVGKTVLLLKLAIDLLDKIKNLEKEPFPVIFNLASWSEEYKNFGDWLNAMLVTNYGFYKKYAKELLKQGKIIFLLDGLDELGRNEKKEKASEKRAKCLASLNEYLRDGRKAVISCRIEEFKQMKELTGQDVPVSAKVEVFDLSKAQVLLALEHAKLHEDIKHHTSAENLLKMFESEENDSLLEALSTPFYFTTAMEIFDQVILTENKLPPTIDQIKRHLIFRFVETKLKNEENPNKFEPKKVIRWLKWLASFMESEKLTTFELAEFQREANNGILLWSIMFFINSFIILTPLYFIINPEVNFAVIIIYATLFSILASINFSPNLSEWSFKPLFNWKIWLELVVGFIGFAILIFFIAFAISIIGIFLVNITFGIFLVNNTFKHAIDLGLFWGLAVALMVSPIMFYDVCGKAGKFEYLRFSYQKLRSKLLFSLFINSCIYLLFISTGTIFYYSFRFQIMPEKNMWLFMIISCFVASFLATPLIRYFIVGLSLFIQGKIPLKYATFLGYAAEARILEKDGGHWRFRHQNLQEYFANLPDKK